MAGWTYYHAHIPHPSQHMPSKGVLTSLLVPQSLLSTGLLSQPPDSRPHRADLGVRVVRDGAGEEEVKGVQSPECKVGKPVCTFTLPVHVFPTAYRLNCERVPLFSVSGPVPFHVIKGTVLLQSTTLLFFSVCSLSSLFLCSSVLLAFEFIK